MTGKLQKVPGQDEARRVFTQACRAFSLWPNVPRELLDRLSREAGELDRLLRAQAALPPARIFLMRCVECEAREQGDSTPCGPNCVRV